jgi:hypothetical protein
MSIHPQHRFEVDPTDHFSDVEPEYLVDACGLIPYWIDVTTEDSFQKQVDDNYGFGLFEMKGGEVDANGVYRYPEDPDLFPLVKWERDGEVAYMYQYAIMSFIKDGEVFVTRVD